jgi:hypothetical protein
MDMLKNMRRTHAQAQTSEGDSPVESTDEGEKTAAKPPTPAKHTARVPNRKAYLLSVILLGIVAIIGIGYGQGDFNAALVDLHLKQGVTAGARMPAKPHKPVVTVKVPTFADSYLDQPQLLSPQPNFFRDYTYFGYNCNGITPVPSATAPTNCPNNVTAGSFKYYKIGTTSTGLAIIIADGGVYGFPGESIRPYFAPKRVLQRTQS